MIVCHCNGVCDREIRRAVREGARTLRAVGRACAAGSGCGGCLAAIASIIVRERVAPGAPHGGEPADLASAS